MIAEKLAALSALPAPPAGETARERIETRALLCTPFLERIAALVEEWRRKAIGAATAGDEAERQQDWTAATTYRTTVEIRLACADELAAALAREDRHE